ncbi:uncharacterized protein E0L32_007677 [Thyridium curvatum]|uniref:Uncharacterized protein n=1 Tax=Thyridium curvatum TaxID=1093900 RepID=A0A507B4A4_9PEZI|nr:uncharacterized protein E0L32_007677 [Thyridium curvatum]TPX11698.1 hypothetical protein E0L32_007677 [Thyridium curvatum]
MSSPSEDQRSGGVPMSLGHKAYLEDKEREAARQQAASAPRAQKVLFKFSDEDVPRLTASKATFDDLAPKWAWILNGKGGVEPVPIIEDSGTTENFISPAQVEQFGFGTRSTTPRLFTQVSGDGFVVRELVDVIWYSNNVQETTHFYVAPPEIPYGMVVGRDFIQEHPGALMDQKPAEAMMLTVQAKAKVNSIR